MKTNNNGEILLVCLCVDDLIFIENSLSMIKEFKASMVKEFEMTGIGLMAHFLGLEVKQRKEGIFISQAHYAKEILDKFAMKNCHRVDTDSNWNEAIKKRRKRY